jgi:hypothetical protein
MSGIPRSAGIGLMVYGLGTFVAFAASGSPGGDYETSLVPDYIASSHWVAAWALWYAGALCAVGLLYAGAGLRRSGGLLGEVLWGLAVAGTATSVVGAFVSGGVDVAMAEGGRSVQTGVPHPAVYLVTEIGNLLAVCSPALLVGVGAILLAARTPMPRWLRWFTGFAGVCGVLAPFFFTLFVYVLWTVVAGVAVLVAAGRAEARTADVGYRIGAGT